MDSSYKKLCKFYKLKNNAKILDVGCGKGFLKDLKDFNSSFEFMVLIYQDMQKKIHIQI